MMPLPVALLVDGVDVAAETLLTDAGYTLVLQTAIPHPLAPIDVQSVYVGLPGAPTRITHAIVAQGYAATEQRTVSEHAIPVIAARQRCLQDHLHRVYDALLATGRQPSIDPASLDAALAAADAA
jgi:hypothetical protein